MTRSLFRGARQRELAELRTASTSTARLATCLKPSANFVAVLSLAFLALASAAMAQPSFDKSFSPDTIGPGSVATLQFDISNGDEFPIGALSFTDILPAGVTLATPASAWTDCLGYSGVITATNGANSISLSDGELDPLSSCAVTVNVTSTVVGTHTNVSGDLTSDAGNSNGATADLIVDDARPGFTKSFSPNPIVPGDTSTLTFTIDNTAGGNDLALMSFVDNLPAGLVVATLPNLSTDCNDLVQATLTANPGASSISLSSGSVAAQSSCTASVDVTALTAGPKGNTTRELTFSPNLGASFLSAGKAGAVLDVERKFLITVFTDDPTPPGGTVDLQFTLTNFNRLHDATGITFTDDLDAALAGLAAIGLPLVDPCGPGSLLSGASNLALTDGSLGPEETCTFGATLQVPAGAVPGSYLNVTSPVVTFVDGNVVVEDAATDDLRVAPVPILTKSFADDPVAAGDTVTLRFEITSSSPVTDTLDISFEDVLLDGLPSAVAPGFDACGPGSSAIYTPPSGFEPPRITLTGGLLGPQESCTFDFILDVDEGLTTGTYKNVTTPITATFGGESITGPPATDTLKVVAAAELDKAFIGGPVLAGGTVTLEFTLSLDPESPTDVTDITFTDDLDAVLAGLEAVGLPINNVCGAGSQLSGTTHLSFTGGSLSPGGKCTFSTAAQVPAGALPSTVTNTTSSVTGMSLGLAVSSPPATSDLVIGGLTFTKSFADDPVLAGDTVTLEFTLDNVSPVADATGLIFTDDLDDTLKGLSALGLPIADPCGTGSTLSGIGGNTVLVLTGGSLPAGTSCTFSVALQVPTSAQAGGYTNATSALSADIGGSPVTIGPATDVLNVIEPLTLAKAFIGDPVLPEKTVTLRFTVVNSAPAGSITGITFTDDLEAALSGLVAIGLPANDVCGAGSQMSGTSLLSFTGGSLGASSQCSFEVVLEVPADAPVNETATNVTSSVEGMVGNIGTSGPPATDILEIGEEPCLAADGQSLTLRDDTVLDSQFYEVCGTIFVGPNFGAGELIVFRNGVVIGVDASLNAGLDSGL
jgi:acyl dehydratase